MPGSNDLDLSTLGVPQGQSQRERTELGQEQFLELMVTQLQNQDPFQPMENGEFLGQMAQFSTVSGIGDMSAALDQLAESLYSSQALQASSMIGRSVLTEGSVGQLGDGESLKGAVDLPFATGNAFVRVTAPNGQIIREFALGNRGAGLTNFEWDGTQADGTVAAPGEYFLTAGYTQNGEETALSTLVSTRVASVSLSGGGANTRITTEAGEELSLSQIRAVL
ncbi:MAG: flagellar hook assembly protein FlgD [Gammaproteobacteria bacterium]|nr:flagellar hook assembly protein FlgD [Gammaproteobacteria bacterium]